MIEVELREGGKLSRRRNIIPGMGNVRPKKGVGGSEPAELRVVSSSSLIGAAFISRED